MFTPGSDGETTAAPSKATSTTPAPESAADVVTNWFNECIQGSDVARNTALYNVVLAATDELKKRLAGR